MIGETIAQYTILEKLGEGGMGVVYKAEDTKLKRIVALKFLPPHLSASPADKTRFVQEAQAASALNHPNVCTIHDIQEHDGRTFIVMEYVQGQTLRGLVGGKPGLDAGAGQHVKLPLNRAIEIGIQIADGLGAAHDKGIVHRDIKPENVMVRKDGIAQIMDFGLARMRSAQGTRLTQQGSTVGTAGYMSPEQIQGADADHRSDIFSLGVVLYELFTGELPFKGVHETALLYEIVNVDPAPMSAVDPAISPDLDAIVFECLQKEPDERYQSVRDISKELKRYKRESSRARATRTMSVRTISTRQYRDVHGEGAAHPSGEFGAVPPGAIPQGGGSEARGLTWRRFLWPGVSLLLAIALAWLAFRPPERETADTLPVMRFPIQISLSSPLVLGAATLAIAPDGKHFVYLAGEPSNPMMYLRPLDKLAATPMTATVGASDPFFSPDGKSVAYFAAGKLMKVSVLGGAAQEICSVPGFMRGGYWSRDGAIYFGHLNRGIFRVDPAGGEPVEVTILDTARGEISHRFPQLLPGSTWVLFTVKFNNISTFDDAVIAAENIETHERRELIRGGSYGRYVLSGHLMYARGTSLFAAPFDHEQVRVSESPIPILDGGMLNPFSGTANFEVSDNGILIYTPVGPAGVRNIQLTWMDRRGKTTPLLPENRPFDFPSLSPDGRKIALTVRAANDDIWIYDLERKSLGRFSFGRGNSDLAVWTPDSREVVYASELGKGVRFVKRSWDGSGSAVELGLDRAPSLFAPPSVAPDGKSIFYSSGGDIYVSELQGGAPSRPVISSPAGEDAPRISPDGSLLAYISDESGRSEVYAVPYPGLGGKWQVSTEGATGTAFWSRKGDELFFMSAGKLMKVDLSREPAIHFSAPQAVCDLPAPTYLVYDVSTDDRKFIVGLYESSNIRATDVNVVVGWFTELKQRFHSAKN